ncbi:MAG: TonB-dependent receptor, partial [Methylobacter sp.]
TPTYTIDKADVETKVNATTVEDVLRYSPSLHMRKRYIGDQNAMMGIRGTNILQTTHNSVYADGMPLHNPVNVSFNGVPRWSMVAPSEIETAEVLYGPFSAQYGGGSMGGVVNLNTKMPEKFEAEMNVTGMLQDMHRGGRNELLGGFRTFLSGGDRIGKFSVYGFYNHLENDGQPMDPIDTATLTPGAVGARTRVTGGQLTQIPTGAPGIIFGDDGTQHVATDLFKLKTAYDLTDDLQARFTIAYEERDNRNNPALSLLRNAAGQTVYSGNFSQNGQNFTVPGTAFRNSVLDRQALNYGINLKGKISKDWAIDTTASYYNPFKDTTKASNFSPLDPLDNGRGQVTDVNAWWATYDLKLATDNFLGRKDLSFMGGYQFVHGSTNTSVFNTNNILVGNRDQVVSDSGGATQTNSVFSQLDWRFLPDWSIMAGARLDQWQALDGHFNDYLNARPNLRVQNFADRDASRISPKASLEFSPDKWTFRYSFSKAYRFPVAEELFANANTFAALSIADPTLGPEDGYFHNFMTQYDIPRGYLRANFFYDTINNEIVSVSKSFSGQNVNAFQAFGQTETIGAEFTVLQNEVFGLPVDLMVNSTFMNKQITKDSVASYVGNEWARIPKLQANASATYHILPVWDTSVGVRYRSDIFQRYENNDTVANVFSGSDEYTFVDFKTTYHLPIHPKLKSSLSVGVDNILDQDRYENNPLAQRSYYASVSLKY